MKWPLLFDTVIWPLWRGGVPLCRLGAPRLGRGPLSPPGLKRPKGRSRDRRHDGPAAGIEETAARHAVPDGVPAVEVAAHQDAELRARAPARLFGELQDEPIEH